MTIRVPSLTLGSTIGKSSQFRQLLNCALRSQGVLFLTLLERDTFTTSRVLWILSSYVQTIHTGNMLLDLRDCLIPLLVQRLLNHMDCTWTCPVLCHCRCMFRVSRRLSCPRSEHVLRSPIHCNKSIHAVVACAVSRKKFLSASHVSLLDSTVDGRELGRHKMCHDQDDQNCT